MGAVSDHDRWRITACGIRIENAIVDARPGDPLGRVVAFEDDGVAIRDRRRTREYLERQLAVLGNAIEPESGYMTELGRAGCERSKRVGIDSVAIVAECISIRGNDGVSANVDPRWFGCGTIEVRSRIRRIALPGSAMSRV
jgi:hypothetical protein